MGVVVLRPPPQHAHPVKMIGVQEDVLNMFLLTHGLLLITNLALVLLFTLCVCIRHNPAFKTDLRLPTTSWFTRQQRRVPAPEPVYVEQPRVRRRRGLGWFGSSRN